MRIKNLEVGVERITHWGFGDEVHLPPDAKPAPAFLPQYRPLDAILQRPSLDERLPDLLQPSAIDPGLLEPSALADTRRTLRDLFLRRAASRGEGTLVFSAAADLLDADEAMDDQVRTALALLLKG